MTLVEMLRVCDREEAELSSQRPNDDIDLQLSTDGIEMTSERLKYLQEQVPQRYIRKHFDGELGRELRYTHWESVYSESLLHQAFSGAT